MDNSEGIRQIFFIGHSGIQGPLIKKAAAERRKTAAAWKKRRTSGRSVSTYYKPHHRNMVTCKTTNL
jgi:hypothetical protein